MQIVELSDWVQLLVRLEGYIYVRTLMAYSPPKRAEILADMVQRDKIYSTKVNKCGTAEKG